MAKVLITDGLQRKSLSVVRSLGKNGIHTYVGEKISFSPAGTSKYCHQSFVYPNPQVHQQQFYQFLLEKMNQTGCNILFPMDDLTLSIMIANRKELEKKCVMPIPNDTSYFIASDKYQTYLWANKSNVHCPTTYMPMSLDELRKLAGEMMYPVVIKPRKSSGSRGIRVAHNEEELFSYYNEIQNIFPYPMLQEFIPQGERYDVCLLYDQNHELKCLFVQKELRHFPITMGPSTVQESVEFPALVELSKRLMNGLNWTGIVEIEFMIDPRSGLPVLMEINPRFWNSLELSIQCGVDFPLYLLKVALNEPFESVFDYEIGKKVRWLIPGDILHFITNKDRFHMNPPFISRNNNKLYDDTWLFTDPIPTMATLIACIRFGVSRNGWKMMFKR